MKTLQQYLDEADEKFNPPVVGDNFAIEIDDVLIESYIVDIAEDGYVIAADDRVLELLEHCGCAEEQALQEEQRLMEAPCDDCGRTPCECDDEDSGTVKEDALNGILKAAGLPQRAKVKEGFAPLEFAPMEDAASDEAEAEADEQQAQADLDSMDEAKYQGREVPLGKPMAGDVKKSKVYVRGPKGNVVKVNFGQKGMKIKKSIPGRRKNFRARHNCDNPGPRWKARYWSCRAW